MRLDPGTVGFYWFLQARQGLTGRVGYRCDASFFASVKQAVSLLWVEVHVLMLGCESLDDLATMV
jgi:hypothetical protein